MTMRPDDVADMFDLPPLPAAAPSTTETADAEEAERAAEAALAAELAATIDAGGVAGDAPDSRMNLRVKVAWPARMQLPDARVVELEVRNISERGVGLMGDEDLPVGIVVDFEMDVPALDEGGRITRVKGAIRTTYSFAHGCEILCGGTWQGLPAGMELLNHWIRGR